VKKSLLPVAAASILSAVVSGGCTDDPFAADPGTRGEMAAPTFRIAPPALSGERLTSTDGDAKYLITDSADLSVTVDGTPVEFAAPGEDGRAIAEFRRPPGTRVNLRVSWDENIPLGNGRTLVLPLATFERPLTIERDMTIDIAPDDYSTDAGADAERDADNDGDSNLLERLMNFDPFNGSSCPESCDPDVDLYIKRVDREITDAIEIDGAYDDEWNDAEFFGRDGRLRIENPGPSDEPGGGNGGPTRFSASGGEPFKFIAMHDGETLFLAVIGDSDASRNTPWGDSSNPENDDSITLFLDTSDPIDESGNVLLVIPLMGLNTGEADSSSSPTARPFSLGLGGDPFAVPEGLRYATCVCDGDRQYWEMSIPLANVGVSPGRPFGLEVRVNDDSDGGDTVSQWFWHAPVDEDGRAVLGTAVAR